MLLEAIRQMDPKRASELIEEAGIKLSLPAEAVARGMSPMTPEVWKELEEKDPYWVQQQREIGEAKQLERLEEQYGAMKDLAASRDRLYTRGPSPRDSATGSTLASRLPTDHYRS